MFADVANSTAMFEKLDPEVVHEIMDRCFRLVMDEVHRHEGTINQFLGDGVMALFGAPIAHEDHAQRACHAALAIQKTLAPYGKTLKNLYGIDFKMRIGLNSGPVVVGTVGDDLRMDYTAKGDTVNLAARMESNAEPGVVMASKNVHKQAKGFFEFDSFGEIHVKGREEPVEAYRLIKPTEVQTRIAASAARGLTRFVGRTREIETLREAFDKAKSGEGQVVGIVGEAGVGKSRLLLEFKNSMPYDEYRYFEGRCLHYGASMPYLPVLDVLRSFVGVKEGEQEHTVREKLEDRVVGLDEGLREIIPPLQELLSLKVDDVVYANLDPKQKREKTFEAIRNLLIRASQDLPLVLTIEDLHWIDRTTEEFLDYMIGWLPRTGILLLLLYRPEYTHQWGSKSYYCMIGVGQLSMSNSAELVAAILEGGDAAPDLRELILGRAAGNPFFMEELTFSLLENGSIQRKGDSCFLAQALSSMQVPDTIQGIIAARLDRLEESLKRIIQVASVIGREFAFRILETISEIKEDLKSGLVNLQGLEFIYEKSLFPELEYIFRHALTQEVAYNSLLLQRRKEIHERIGKALEELYPHRLEEFYEMLAWHYSHSDNRGKACQFLKLSGQKAARSHSHREAFRQFKEALEVLLQMPQTMDNKRDRLEVLRVMAVSMRTIGYPEGSIEFFLEGEALARELGDNKTLLHFLSYLGIYYLVAGGDPALGKTYIEKALNAAELIGDVEAVAPAVLDAAFSHGFRGESWRICEVAPKCLELIERTGTWLETFGRPYNIYPTLKTVYGCHLGAIGNFVLGECVIGECLDFVCANKISNPYTLGLVELYTGSFYSIKGDGEKTVEHHKRAAELFEKSQATFLVGPELAWAAYGYLLLEQPEKALEYLEKGLKMHLAMGIPLWLAGIHTYLSMAYLQLGNPEKALLHAEHGVNLSRASNERSVEAWAEMELGRALGAGGHARFDEAREHILRGIETVDELKLKPTTALGYFYLGELSASFSHTDEAREHLRKAETMFREMGMEYWPGKAQQALAKLKK
jgi:class 3 adenylate cyclase/tetratricopeptide (TPR) repeat protein